MDLSKNWVIVPMNMESLPQVAKLEKACFSDAWNERMLESALHSTSERIYVLLDEAGSLAGYMSLMQAADEGELLRVAVDPVARRQGLGDLLMNYMLQWAKERALVALFLEVRSMNAPAIGLYEKHGFERIGLRKNYYHDPADHAVLMKIDCE